MKSNQCTIKSDFSKSRIFTEAEKTAQYFELSKKAALRLRLLTEEVTGMMQEIAGKYEGTFWIEADPEEHATGYWQDIRRVDFQLHLQLRTRLDEESRKQLLSAATTGQNDPPRGVAERLRIFLDRFALDDEDLAFAAAQQEYYMPSMKYMYDSLSMQDDTMVWTLSNYSQKLSSQKQNEEWDELEKSILANLADDVVVRIHGRSVEVIVSKAFQKAASGGFQ